MIRKALSLGAILALSVSLTSAAGAFEVRSAAVQAEVGYSDLDTTHTQGATILLARIKSAAHRVCSPEPVSGDLARLMDFRRCVRDAVGRAVAELDNPFVSALYGKRNNNELAAAR